MQNLDILGNFNDTFGYFDDDTKDYCVTKLCYEDFCEELTENTDNLQELWLCEQETHDISDEYWGEIIGVRVAS